MNTPSTERVMEAAQFLKANGFADVAGWLARQEMTERKARAPKRSRQLQVRIGKRKTRAWIDESLIQQATEPNE